MLSKDRGNNKYVTHFLFQSNLIFMLKKSHEILRILKFNYGCPVLKYKNLNLSLPWLMGAINERLQYNI